MESLKLGFGEQGEYLCLVTGGQAQQAKEKHGKGTRASTVEEKRPLAGLPRGWYEQMQQG